MNVMDLLKCLTLPINHNWGDKIPNPKGALYFRDNGASVLAVAHLDSVMVRKPILRKNSVVGTPQLDDRLGVWVLLDLLPKLGVTIDVLLTDCEERGLSTAEYFTPPREYNWMFAFDRRGADVVMYQYEHSEYVDLVENYGFHVNWGTYSDICSLEHLGITGFNIGAGYYREHTRQCHADLNVTKRQAERFARFWTDHNATPLPAVITNLANPDNNFCNYWKSDDWWWTINKLANEYDYDSVSEFIRDGGLELCDMRHVED